MPSDVTRVALVLDNLGVGGTELNTLKTSRALRERGVQPVLFHLQPDGPLATSFDEEGVPRVHVPVHPISSGRLIGDASRLAREARRAGVALLHTQDVYSNTIAILASRIAGLPHVASQRWTTAVPSRLVDTGHRLAMSLADAVVVNSSAVAAHATARMIRRHDRVFVVPNIVEDRVFAGTAESERARLREEYGLPETATVIVTVARLSPVKDHRTLLAAVAQVRTDGVDARLVLVGDGPLRAELQAEAARLGIADAVTFAGESRDVRGWLSAGDLACLTSVTEGFPNAIVEAMAAGLAVVATRAGGIPDVVEHMRTGLLAAVGDVPAIARHLRTLATNTSLRRQLAAAGRSLVESRHTSRAAGEVLLSAYATALRRRHRELHLPEAGETASAPLALPLPVRRR